MQWEQLVIGSVIVDQTVVPPDVETDDFSIKTHREIWKHEKDLADRGVLSIRSLSEALKAEGELENIGDEDYRGVQYLEHLENIGDPSVIDEFVRQLKEASGKRKLGDLGRDLVVNSRNGKVVGEIVQDTLRKLITIDSKRMREAKPISTEADEIPKRIEKIRAGEQLSWTPDLLALRKILGSLDDNDFAVFVADTGSGKSSYFRYEALKTAEKGNGVLTISLENDLRETQTWAISQRYGIDHIKMKNPKKLNEEEIEQAKEGVEWLKSLPWYIEDVGFIDVDTIISISRRMALTKDISIIFIDGMNLVKERSDGMYETISEVSQKLRSLANELKIPVLASTQWNRKGKEKQDTPELHNLLYAGENAARKVIAIARKKMSREQAGMFDLNKSSKGLLFREESNWKEIVLFFKVLKNTNGITGVSEDVLWQKPYGRFMTLDRKWDYGSSIQDKVDQAQVISTTRPRYNPVTGK